MATKVLSAFVVAGLLFSASAISSAWAQGLRAVRPLDGYVCKKLNITEREAMSANGGGVSIRTAPSASAPPAALAPSVLLARSPLHVVSGFVEVLRLNGQPGWIEESRVKPFDPTERCVPSIMSNGRPGIG